MPPELVQQLTGAILDHPADEGLWMIKTCCTATVPGSSVLPINHPGWPSASPGGILGPTTTD
jgi:hypothetical protein